MKLLSQLVFDVTTTDEQRLLAHRIAFHLRDDEEYVELRETNRLLSPDARGFGSEESTLYVVVHTDTPLVVLIALSGAGII